jgi:hypothetical protein
MSIETAIARIKRMREATAPDSPQLRQALTRIGVRLAAQIRLNIRKEGIIDQGALFNSIDWKLGTTTDGAFLEVGTYGIKYAAMNEYGGKVSKEQFRAMFAAIRQRHGKDKRPSKGIIKNGYWRARPFIRPALRENRAYILDIIRTLGKTE